MHGTRGTVAVRNTVGLTGFVNGGLRSMGLRSMSDALRRAESVLLGGGQQTARRNAWDAVCENRRLAQDRQEIEVVLGNVTRLR
jgi:hypothetical protein